MVSAIPRTLVLYASASEDVPYSISGQVQADELQPSFVQNEEWYQSSARVSEHSRFEEVAALLRNCHQLSGCCGFDDINDKLLSCMSVKWESFLTSRASVQLSLDDCMELLVEVLREFLTVLRLSMNETQQAVFTFETSMTGVLQQAFGNKVKACLPTEFPRYAHQVMVKTSKKSHSVEARQILKYWGSLQQSGALKRCEKRQIQHQTGLTMQQVQNWLSNFKKRKL